MKKKYILMKWIVGEEVQLFLTSAIILLIIAFLALLFFIIYFLSFLLFYFLLSSTPLSYLILFYPLISYLLIYLTLYIFWMSYWLLFTSATLLLGGYFFSKFEILHLISMFLFCDYLQCRFFELNNCNVLISTEHHQKILHLCSDKIWKTESQ